ncbi:hypothetical protein LOAG_00826 [Loa loa]|uniref:Uncharacterized protein n=1 Tax=Loa loa TaxID=7209 RepID=A0A1S0UCD8_LOALO|nr:hypothetical protein LOAG_00826 [Loa loa]EFO27647.1 hypothetical protein LOAG_00826 [Loa loa]
MIQKYNSTVVFIPSGFSFPGRLSTHYRWAYPAVRIEDDLLFYVPLSPNHLYLNCLLHAKLQFEASTKAIYRFFGLLIMMMTPHNQECKVDWYDWYKVNRHYTAC